MNDKALMFELASILVLIILGTVLVMNSLPGWGLIVIAGVLGTLSFGLRQDSLAPSKLFVFARG